MDRINLLCTAIYLSDITCRRFEMQNIQKLLHVSNVSQFLEFYIFWIEIDNIFTLFQILIPFGSSVTRRDRQTDRLLDRLVLETYCTRISLLKQKRRRRRRRKHRMEGSSKLLLIYRKWYHHTEIPALLRNKRLFSNLFGLLSQTCFIELIVPRQNDSTVIQHSTWTVSQQHCSVQKQNFSPSFRIF